MKKCNAGKVDGIIGSKTIRAAERFAYSSNFPQKSNLVYNEEFFNHLRSSNHECKVATKNQLAVQIEFILLKNPNTNSSKIAKLMMHWFVILRSGMRWDVVKVTPMFGRLKDVD